MIHDRIYQRVKRKNEDKGQHDRKERIQQKNVEYAGFFNFKAKQNGDLFFKLRQTGNDVIQKAENRNNGEYSADDEKDIFKKSRVDNVASEESAAVPFATRLCLYAF